MITSYLYQSERLQLPSSFAVTAVETHEDQTLTTWTYPHPVSILSLMIYVVVLIAVPFLDLFVYPCAGAYAPTIIIRVGIGLCFAFCSSAAALASESVRVNLQYATALSAANNCSKFNVVQPLYNGEIAWYCVMDFSFLWLLPQFIFLGLAETFINVGGTYNMYVCLLHPTAVCTLCVPYDWLCAIVCNVTLAQMCVSSTQNGSLRACILHCQHNYTNTCICTLCINQCTSTVSRASPYSALLLSVAVTRSVRVGAGD